MEMVKPLEGLLHVEVLKARGDLLFQQQKELTAGLVLTITGRTKKISSQR